MKELSVSIVIPTYNRAALVGRSVRSVLAAVAPEDEVIVVDDGSTDDTRKVLEPYGDRIRYLLRPHRGVGAARNCGVAAARNALVAFNDSDDEWFSDKLVLQRAFMQARPDVVFCFSDFGLREEGESDGHHGLYDWHQDPRDWGDILGPAITYSSIANLPPGREDFNVHIGSLYLSKLRTNYVAAQSAVVRRDQAGAALHFGEDIGIHEEYECFVRLARLGQAAYFDCETFWQWGHRGPRVTDLDESQRIACRISVLERTFGDDKPFLTRNGSQYKEALRAEYLKLVRRLIVDGQSAEARAKLRLVDDGPLIYRFLAMVPSTLIRSFFGLRRLARKRRTAWIMALAACNACDLLSLESAL